VAISELERKYRAWVRELINGNPSLKGHWIKIMSIIELTHPNEVKAMERIWSRFLCDSDINGGFMALIINAEQEADANMHNLTL
jgi:hypothetical protein